MWKMSIQYQVLGFEPTPLKHELSHITTSPRLPPNSIFLITAKIGKIMQIAADWP